MAASGSITPTKVAGTTCLHRSYRIIFLANSSLIHTGKTAQEGISRSYASKDSEHLTSFYQTLGKVMLQVQKDSSIIIIIITTISPHILAFIWAKKAQAIPWHHPSSLGFLFFLISAAETVLPHSSPSFHFCISLPGIFNPHLLSEECRWKALMETNVLTWQQPQPHFATTHNGVREKERWEQQLRTKWLPYLNLFLLGPADVATSSSLGAKQASKTHFHRFKPPAKVTKGFSPPQLGPSTD